MPAISSAPPRSCVQGEASIVGPLSHPKHHCSGLIGQIKKTKSHVQCLCLPEGVGSNGTEHASLYDVQDQGCGSKDQRNQTEALCLSHALCLAPIFRSVTVQSIPNYVWWWSQTGSNRRHPACKAGALPAELWPHFLEPTKMVGPGGLEPPTSRLSGVRSNHLSYGPPGRHSPALNFSD
jgi:hypothetical protein